MPITTKIGTIHYDKLLSKYAADYKSQTTKLIYNEIMASVPVEKQTDLYTVFESTGKFDIANDERGPGTAANFIDNLKVTAQTYFAKEKSLRGKVRDQDVNAAAPILMEQRRKTNNLMDSLLLNLEKRVADLVFDPANFTSHTSVVADKWDLNDYMTNDPRIDVEPAIRLVSQTSGIRPNILVINEEVADGIMRSPFVTSVMPDDDFRIATQKTLAAFFKIAEVIVGEAVLNTANESQTKSLDTIWGKNCLLAYRNPSSGLDDPSFAKTFKWTGGGQRRSQNRGLVGVRVYPNDELKEDYVEVDMNYDNKITFLDSSFLLSAVIS